LERLTKLHPKLIDLSLGRVKRLLDRLGNPHQKLPPVIHIAGTNGKGSVLAFLRAFLEAANYRVHVHTSPHLERFNERIRLAGNLIDEDALSALLEECEAANDGDPITYFEITTVAALLAFARTPADIVLLETGLGGRLDATNVVDEPALTVITPISLDHQQFLGDTLAEIAAEKAGILKPNIPVISADQEDETRVVIAAKAESLDAKLIYEGEDWHIQAEPDEFIFETKDDKQKFPRPTLVGDHQLNNAAQAIACVRHLEDFIVPDHAIRAGLRNVEWPARLQRLRTGSLVEMLPGDWELWLDGGHNTAAAEVIAAEVKTSWADAPLYLVFGMLNSKQPGKFLSVLAPSVSEIRTVAIPGEAATLSADEAMEAAKTVGIHSSPANNVEEAVKALVEIGPASARILICGSLYLAGTVLADNA
jgi:dihydrofolate synthase / folylpolyglutamate synthase